MLIYAMPALTVSSGMLVLDRYLDFHFFTNDAGGNMMNYANIFWMFGHPEVYILILPAFGVFSEISSTFSGKRLYGYTSLVIASMSIAVISFTVWLHHFFTMGQSAGVNIAFGIATMIIGVPTGVKIYDWMATMWRGRVRITTPIVYLTGFFLLFVIGGLSGIILANPSIDYQVHNSTFLVAHFHNVIIPGVLFGMLAGIHYWFPKAFGFRLSETWGRRTAFLFVAGFIGSPPTNFIDAALLDGERAGRIGIRPEHFDVSTTEGAWEGTIGVAEHLGSDTFLHIHGVAGCDPMTVRVDGELSVKHGDRIFLTPQADKLHRFDAQGLRVE